jgi:glucokinase
MEMKYTIGVDIGGTKIASAIIDKDSNILYRAEVPSHASEKESMFKQVATSIESILIESDLKISDIKGMGVGVPGKVDRNSGTAIFQNNLPWRNFPIAHRLKDYFSIDNVTIDNDVYMAAFAEWNMHGAVHDETFVYFTVSTGISCSIIHQGEFLRGAGFAGEIGLLPVTALSFQNGMERLEQAASGPAIQRIMNEDISTKDILELYKQSDANAKIIVSNMADAIAHGCYPICCLVDPHKIVFGGGVINHHPYLLDLIRKRLEKYLTIEQKQTLNRMHLSKLKGNSGVIGAGLSVF